MSETTEGMLSLDHEFTKKTSGSIFSAERVQSRVSVSVAGLFPDAMTAELWSRCSVVLETIDGQREKIFIRQLYNKLFIISNLQKFCFLFKPLNAELLC